MATLVLGAVGRAVLGPVGGPVGTLLGSRLDQRLLGGGRDGPRLADPAVQGASYGDPLPVVCGRMRAAGLVVWSSGIRESPRRSGGGKRAPATTGHACSASFAVALSSRPVLGVGRIWVDGRLLRDAGGGWLSPVTMRLHHGGEDQPPDPLIVAAEGLDAAPAYRGVAYAVFEDLPLADYGNRIPNLSFEIIADEDPIDLGRAAVALAGVAGVPVAATGDFPAVAGVFAGRSGSLDDTLSPLLAAAGAAVAGIGAVELVGGGGPVIVLEGVEGNARAGGGAVPPERRRRAGAAATALELGFFDSSRDYQAGLQRARRGPGDRCDTEALGCAMSPSAAKALAGAMLARRQAARLTMTLRLPWRHLGIGPGDRLTLGADGDIWRVRESRFEGFVLALDLERDTLPMVAPQSADGGRAASFGDAAAGLTTLKILDLPALPGELPDGPRLLLAAAGSGSGWRRAPVLVSRDGGFTEDVAAELGPAVVGVAVTALPPGPVDRWDRFSTVEVELLNDGMWLEARPPSAVLAGANLALLGNELVHFADAEAIAPRRFRLSGLLRGRRGSEAAMVGHRAGEDFVLIDAAVVPVPVGREWLGERWRFRPAGAGDSGVAAQEVLLSGGALRPLSVAHLRARRRDGAIEARWIRRSRGGFAWPDFVDAPLAEPAEAYRVTLLAQESPLFEAEVAEPRFHLALDLLPPAAAGPLLVRVEQLGIVPGAPATLLLP